MADEPISSTSNASAASFLRINHRGKEQRTDNGAKITPVGPVVGKVASQGKKEGEKKLRKGR